MYDLECLDLRKSFDDFAAVRSVSLAIPGGSFFSILGPSGCGKTTLMRMIAGFEDPSSGDIRIKGRSVLRIAPNRRNVKMVFQHLALFPMMSVGENVAYGLRCRKVGRAETEERVARILERVGLPGIAQKRVTQLSGGQKQRVAIARCMVLEPDVLLLDEPLGALDLKLREHMKVELKLLQHQFRTTFLYITHDQSEALVMSDQVAVMNGGVFEQIGSPRELYHAPQTAFVAGFVGDSNRWTGRVVETAGAGLSVGMDHGGTILGSRSGTGTLPGAGAKVTVFVRPAAIRLQRAANAGAAPSPGGEANRLVGTVTNLLFNGADSRALVRLGDDLVIEAALPQSGPDSTLEVGEAVTLAFDAADTRCFSAGA